jgi:hypothetical protein
MGGGQKKRQYGASRNRALYFDHAASLPDELSRSRYADDDPW